MDYPPKWCKYVRREVGKLIHVYDPIFTRNYYICSGVSRVCAIKTFKKELNVKVDIPDGVDGYFFTIESKGVEIGCIFSKDKTRTLMHELLHATIWGLKAVGIDVTEASDEVAAYYQEFLFKWATKK